MFFAQRNILNLGFIAFLFAQITGNMLFYKAFFIFIQK